MESEKVKEIKEKLQEEIFIANSFGDKLRKVPTKELQNLLTLINELESENERLSKSDTSKEESSIEYYNLYKDLKRKNKDLNELCELQRVSIAESFVRENQLKDRIAELEKQNAKNANCLKQFAERLKKKAKEIVAAENVDVLVELLRFSDELVKEFSNENGKF